MKKLLLLFILFFLSSVKVLANEPYDFINAVVNSLTTCHIAENRIKNNKAESSNEIDSAITLMKDMMVFSREIESARIPIKPYLNDEDEIVRTTAELYNVIFLSAIKNNEKLISMMEQSFNAENSNAQMGTFMRKFSEIFAENEDTWRQLTYATVYATYSLVDNGRLKDGHLAFLKINREQRKNLVKSIENGFGDEVKGGAKGGQFPIVASASLLWEFLNKEWKSADDK